MASNLPLKQGQELAVKWKDADGHVQQVIQKLNLDPTTNEGRIVPSYVTHIDARGISVYIVRGHGLGGDLEAFIPESETMWQAYFEPLSTIVRDYSRTSHFKKIFPREFL